MEPLREQLRSRGLLPHQVDFVEMGLASGEPRRILLADGPGLGRTNSCVALVWAWTQRFGKCPRTIILAPSVLQPQWQVTLADFASIDSEIVDAQRFRQLEARADSQENPWALVNVAVSTIDFVKEPKRLETLLDARWDIAILDEAHQATPTSQRGKVLRSLWVSEKVDLVVCATSTPGLLGDSSLDLYQRKDVRVLVREAQDVLDWEGRPLEDLRQSDVTSIVQISPSPQERILLETTRSLAQERIKEGRAGQLLGTALVKAAASSPFALDGVVRRALLRFQPEIFSATVDSDDESFDLPDEIEVPEVSDPHFQQELASLTLLIDVIETDAKWLACTEALQSNLKRSDGRGILFCDFVDTAQYTAGMSRELDIPTQVVTGANTKEERKLSLDSFRANGGVLVVTSASAISLDIPPCKLYIHYDVPWNTYTLDLRATRVQRYIPANHFYFVDDILTSTLNLSRTLEAFNAARQDPSPAIDLLQSLQPD